MKALRRTIATTTAVLTVGCHVMKPVNLVENPDPSSRPEMIEIVTRNGESQTIYRPLIRGDSLLGFSDDERSLAVGVPLRDIQKASVRQFSGGRTAALVFGSIAAVGVLWFVAYLLLLHSVGIY